MDAIFWNFSPVMLDRNAKSTFYRNADFISSRYVGSYKIAHWIRKHDYQAQVIDFVHVMNFQQLYLATKKFITNDTLVLGISTTFMCIESYLWADGTQNKIPEFVILVAKAIKKEYPKLKVILGGYSSDFVSGYDVVDASIMSYLSATEDVFLEYLDHYRKGSPLPLGELTSIRVDRSSESVQADSKPRICYNQARSPKYSIEMDDFKFVEQDVILSTEPLPLDISRGCIFACRFCNFPHLGKKKLDYVRGMDYIRSELIYNYETFGVNNYLLLDDTFNDTEWKLQEFLKMTNSLPFKINYTAYLRADLLERFTDMPHLLAESGLVGAMFGLESLHPYASNLVGKGWSGRKAREYIPYLCHDVWKGQIVQQLSMIVGLPQETKEDLLSTFDWFKQNKLHNADAKQLKIFKNPGSMASEFEKNPEKYGFTFDHKGRWVNETWTSMEAYSFSENELQPKYKEIQISGCWFVPLALGLGYSREKILTTKQNEAYRKFNIAAHAIQNAMTYYQRLMSL